MKSYMPLLFETLDRCSASCGPTKEEQLQELNTELLDALKLARRGIHPQAKGAIQKVDAAIAKAEAFKNQQP